MRKNKGYTLVELLVAVAVLLLVMAEVGALMVNSQSLYKNGYYEVNLQENSQQAVQTIQDLLMNANVVNSLAVDTRTSLAGIPSDIISFQTQERQKAGDSYTGLYKTVSYKIGRKTDLVSGTVAKTGKGGEYTDLVLVRNADGEEETVSLIAEGIQSIYITKNNNIEITSNDDMFNVKNADMVSISMNMVNESYRYSTSGEIYLRNKIGSGGDPMPDGGGGSAADVDINVLRIHEYDLTKFVPKEYNAGFEFQDTATGAYYSLTSEGKLKCDDNLNANWSWEKEGIVLASSSDGSKYKIKIYTQPVNDGCRMPIYSWGNTTASVNNAIPVNGICTCEKCAKDLVMDAQITLHIGNGSMSKIDESGSKQKVDLAVMASNGEHGFTVRRHKDEVGGDPTEKIGTAPANWNFSSWFDNETFCRVGEGVPIDIKTMYLLICPMKLKDGATVTKDIWELDELTHTYQYRNEYYEYMLSGKYGEADPYKHPSVGNAAQRCMSVPHVGSTGANCFAKFTLGRIHTDNKANGFSVNTKDHSDAAKYYWNYMIDNESYIRMHIWCTFDGLTDTSDHEYTYDCYGYYFPQNEGAVGKKEQQDWLMNIITTNPPAEDIKLPVTADDPHPYTYYDMNH